MRIVTRGDLDGLTGAVIVSCHEQVDGIELIHPQDITSGRADITSDDVLINLPYHPNCGLWFDHHAHTATYPEPPKEYKGKYGVAPSASQLVYEYYGGVEQMPQFEELVRETNRLDSADLTPEDVKRPQRYIRLGFTIDGRTGIGPFQDYFLALVDMLRAGTPIEEVLEHPEVARRCEQMEANEAQFSHVLVTHSVVDENVVITDLRSLDEPPIGNRFLVYALYPMCNVSVRLHWGPRREFVVAVVGHSIFDRSCATDVGELAARFGGGGHRGAGSIPIAVESADETFEKIVAELREEA